MPELELLSLRPESVVLHFGTPKTGSTSIQISLHRYLRDSRFCYLDVSGSCANVGLVTAFRDNLSQRHFHARVGTPEEAARSLRETARERLKAELRRSEGRIAILSAEALCGFREHEFRALCQFLREHGREVCAAGYVRRPKQVIESNFQQVVKAGNGMLKGETLSLTYPHHRRVLEMFDAVLGRENVHIWPLDPDSFPGGCVVRDFCTRLGIDFEPKNVVRANKGLSFPALALLYVYRCYGPGYGSGLGAYREKLLLVRHLAKLRGPKLRFHSSLVAPVIAKHRNHVAWLEKRVGASLAENLAAHDAHGVRSEEDILRCARQAARWLAGQLGADHLRQWRHDMSPVEIAQWVHLLRRRLAETDARRERIPEGLRPYVFVGAR